MRRCALMLTAAALAALLPLPALAQLPQRAAASTARPEQAGLSSERLQSAMAALDAEVKAGNIPGALLLVARKGKVVFFEGTGQLDPEAKSPMIRDGIFRLYSMTKPITSVAAMMLVEEGRLSLADPVAKYIPEFAAVKVGVETPGADKL